VETFHQLLFGLGVALHPTNLLYCLFGTLVGTLVGVLPGVGPPAALSLLLPITFYAPPTSTIIMLAGIAYGAMYGGSTTSILVNIPGEAASVVTTLDGYQMARNGQAGPALGMSAFGSFIAGTITIFFLIFLAPILAEYALEFGPPEYFALMVLGLSMVGYLAQGSTINALMMVCFGLFLGTIGLDPITAMPRFIYKITTLMDGVGLIQVVIGLFGISEVLVNVERHFKQEVFDTKIRRLFPNLQDWKKSIFPIVRGTLIGFVMGVIPGMSVVIPTFVSYVVEKRLSKYPEKFGTGVIEGVAGPESANNAAATGTLIPMLSLGIPTGASTALLLGALMIHGLRPGPLLIKEAPEVFWGLVASLYLGNVMLLVLNLPLIGVWVKILKIKYQYLFSIILLLCVVGSYITNNNPYDVVVMAVFGFVGYLMKKFNYEAAPLVLALVLGPMMERAFQRSLIISGGNLGMFFTRPISSSILIIALFVLISPLLWGKKLLGKVKVQEGE